MSNSKEAEQADKVTRRMMLKTAAGAGIALLMAGRTQAATDQATSNQATSDQWTAVGKSDLFVAGKPKRVTVKNGGVLYITRLDPKAATKSDAKTSPPVKTSLPVKTLTATSAKCTHHGCEVEWTSEASEFQCPCHGAAFASDGKNIHGTSHHLDKALPALPSLPVREKDGQVEVNLAGVVPNDIEPDGY